MSNQPKAKSSYRTLAKRLKERDAELAHEQARTLELSNVLFQAQVSTIVARQERDKFEEQYKATTVELVQCGLALAAKNVALAEAAQRHAVDLAEITLSELQ